MGETAAITGQTMCQPVIRLMQYKGQALGMRYLNVQHAVKQPPQGGKGKEFEQARAQLCGFDLIAVVPV
jgi:hypothetical protein